VTILVQVSNQQIVVETRVGLKLKVIETWQWIVSLLLV